MQLRFLSCAALSLLTASGTAQAQSTLGSVDSFQDFGALVTAAGTITDLSGTLIVMDDDDTLTMMPCPAATPTPATCQYLGGPAWFNWQNDLLSTYTANGGSTPLDGQVATTADDLYDISDLLLSLNQMTATDSDLMSTLTTFQASGAQLMVLTARDTDVTTVTEGQFKGVVAGGGAPTLFDVISTSAPLWLETGKTSAAGTIGWPEFCDVKTPIAYQNGAIYATGQNKGDVLACFLGYTNYETIRRIFFLDDTAQNVADVHQAFLDQDLIEVQALHFTGLSAHKAAFGTVDATLTPYQAMAKERWDAVSAALTGNLLQPTGLTE